MAGRLALVTGSTSGIGAAISKTLAAAGADVVVHGLPEAVDEGNEFAKSIRQEFGVKSTFIGADLFHQDEASHVVQHASKSMDGKSVDILVS